MGAAVAGVGAVILAGPGIAIATPPDSTETSDANGADDPGAAGGGTSTGNSGDPANPTATGSSQPSAADPAEDADTAVQPDTATASPAADESADAGVTDTEVPDVSDSADIPNPPADDAPLEPESSTRTADSDSHRKQAVPAADVTGDRPESTGSHIAAQDTEPARLTARDTANNDATSDTMAVAATVADVPVVSKTSTITGDTGPRATTVRTAANVPRVTVKSIVTDVLTWFGLGSLAKGLPIPALPVPGIIESLWLGIRERQYLHNNQRPVANPTLSGQGPGGVITGSLNSTDYDDATLTYTVADGPQRGTVVVDSAGHFVYTPNAATAAAGGVDRFTIAVDDRADNPAHVHGLLGLLGLTKPVTKTITVSVSPSSRPTVSGPESGGTGSTAVADALRHLLSRDDLAITMNANGTVGVIDGSFTDTLVFTAADAAGVLNSVAPLLGATAGFADQAHISTQSIGRDHEGDVVENFYRFSESIGGISVLGSEVILTVGGNGTVTGLFNHLVELPSGIDIAPDAAVDEESEARLIASAAYLGATNAWQPDPAALDSFVRSAWFRDDLVVYGLDEETAPSLAWRVVVVRDSDADSASAEQTLESGATFFIHANGVNAGQVIVQVSNLRDLSTTTTAKDSRGQTRTFTIESKTSFFFFKSYSLIDSPRNIATYRTSYGLFGMGAPVLPGSVVTKKRSGWDPGAVSAHANTEIVFDYFNTVLGLNSFDGHGAPVRVSIGYNPRQTLWDYLAPYDNAFWDPDRQQFAFGTGSNLMAALDVVSHEFTHAVVSYAVGDGGSVLAGKESGALNEAYADILGSIIEGKTGTDRWMIGEDSTYPGGPVRNLADPSSIVTSLGPHRENYASRYRGSADNGGEHVNSTIFSFAAYKMMTNPATSAISADTWAKVFYHSLGRLSSNATFADGRNAVISSARALGLTNAQRAAIENAFDEVGIDGTAGGSGIAA